MVTVTEIIELKDYLVKDFYGETRKEQRMDQKYYDDNFDVPQIDSVRFHLSRLGMGARLVDNPVEHIITQNPQVLIEDRKITERLAKVLHMLNQVWIPALRRQVPNPFRESCLNAMLRGESWLYLPHNSAWTAGKPDKRGLPVFFKTPDPLTVFADPEEYDGVPKRVIIWAERMPYIIRQLDPGWSTKEKGPVTWLAYFDEKQRYFEADGKPVMGGLQPNPYGDVPWVHALSGFGKQSETGDPVSLIVGRLRKARDALVRRTALTSSMDLIIYMMGQPQTNFQVRPGVMEEYTEESIRDFKIGFGVGNIIPKGLEIKPHETATISPDMFAYLSSIDSEIERENPSVLSGLPAGESGRQQNMAGSSAMSRFRQLVENIENQFAVAIGRALKEVKTMWDLGLAPNGIAREDIPDDYRCIVKLQAESEINQEMKATQGSRLWQNGEIDLMENLVKFKGYTQDEARKMRARIIAEKLIFSNPAVLTQVGMEAAEEIGAEKYLAALQQEQQTAEQQQRDLMATPTDMKRTMGEVETPLGMEMPDESLSPRPLRRSPVAYGGRGGR